MALIATLKSFFDASGRAAKVSDLSEPQTARLANRQREFSTHPSRGLTPARLARILESAEQGDILAQHDLFLDMEEKDAHLYAEMSKRRRAILTVPWSIAPPRNASAAEKSLAGELEELIRDIPNFEDVLLDMMDGVGHGFANLEIEWAREGALWLPGAITHRPQSWFLLDRDTRTELRLRDDSVDGAALTPFGWISHVHRAKSGYIARSGLHRVLSWPFLFKNYAVRDLAEFLEIYGLPLRMGKYPSGASDAEKSTLLAAVVGLGHNAAGIMPESMAIEIQEAAKGSEGPFLAMSQWAESRQEPQAFACDDAIERRARRAQPGPWVEPERVGRGPARRGAGERRRRCGCGQDRCLRR
jgi:phage gp29-like protein